MALKISPERQAFLRTPEGREFQADIKEWHQSVALRQSLGNSAPLVELPTSSMLRRPGELEHVLEGIKARFKLADQRHREHIDREVMLCIRAARLLNSSGLAMREILGGEWAEFWRKSEKRPSEALRFVFAKVHNDPKKASFYYRATRALFEEGVEPDDLPKRITAGGGYRALAEENVRFSRPKKTTGPNNDAADADDDPNGDDGSESQPYRKPAPQDGDGKDEPTVPRDRERVSKSETTGNGNGEKETVLFATFEGDGREFLRLSVGSHAYVCLVVTGNDAGQRTVKIYCAIADE